jgi:DNA-binding IclR family transcriptional regulator
MTKAKKYVIGTVIQAGEVLRFVTEAKEPVGASEIAKALDISANTAFRLCITLAEMRFLRQAGDRYELGDALPHFWARYRARREADRDRITRELQALHIEEDTDGR